MNYPVLTNEPELLAQIAKGDERAFATIYRHYPPIVKKFLLTDTAINEQDADDIIQNVFEKVWRWREELTAIHFFKGYILSTSSNMFLNSVRHRDARDRAYQHLSFRQKRDYTPIEDNLLYRFYDQQAQQAIRALAPRDRQVYELTAIHDLSQVQVAGELNVSRETVRKTVIRVHYIITTHLRDHAEMMITWVPFIFITLEKLFL